MRFKFTKTQRKAMEMLRDGKSRSFGYGYGKYRVALRALILRAPSFVTHEPALNPHDEVFTITASGTEAIF